MYVLMGGPFSTYTSFLWKTKEGGILYVLERGGSAGPVPDPPPCARVRVHLGSFKLCSDPHQAPYNSYAWTGPRGQAQTVNTHRTFFFSVFVSL